MADSPSKGVGIIGIGGAAKNSIGYALANALYYECHETGIPELIALYNRPVNNPYRAVDFLNSMMNDIRSRKQLRNVFGNPKENGIIKNEDNSQELVYKHGSRKIAARACPTLDDLLGQTDSSECVVVVSYDAASGWYDWLKQASPEEKVKVRQYLYAHNLEGAVEVGEALKRHCEKTGHAHQAHKVVVTNPPCRITDTIRIAAGQGAGPGSLYSAYAARDKDRIYEIIKTAIRPEGKYNLRMPLEDEDRGKIINQIRHTFPVGRHAGSSAILWSAMWFAAQRFYEFSFESRLVDREDFKRYIAEESKKAFLNELEAYGGRTTEMIVPTLTEVVLNILNDDDAEELEARSIGVVFKMPGSEEEFTFLWPTVHVKRRTMPFIRFEYREEENIGLEPETHDFGALVGDLISREDERKDCYDTCDSIAEEHKETGLLVKNPEERRKFIEAHKDCFKIKKPDSPGVYIPPVVVETSLDDLVRLLGVFLEKELYEDSYDGAYDIIKNLGCSAEHISQLVKQLEEFLDKESFSTAGYFISALVNKSAGENISLDFEKLEGIDGLGTCLDIGSRTLALRGKFNNYVLSHMRSGLAVIRGTVENSCAEYTEGGICEIYGNAGDFFAKGMSGGRLSLIGDARQYAGQGMKGGLLQIKGKAGDYALQEQQSGKAEFHGGAANNACERQKGGEAVFFKPVRDYACCDKEDGLANFANGAGKFIANGQKNGTTIVKGAVGKEIGKNMTGGEIRIYNDMKTAELLTLISDRFRRGDIFHNDKKVKSNEI
jgi:hypothetical protein